MLFNLDFAKNTIFSCFFFFFLMIDLRCSIPAAIAQIFNPIVELLVPIGISAEEEKAEIETHPIIVGHKIRK